MFRATVSLAVSGVFVEGSILGTVAGTLGMVFCAVPLFPAKGMDLSRWQRALVWAG